MITDRPDGLGKRREPIKTLQDFYDIPSVFTQLCFVGLKVGEYDNVRAVEEDRSAFVLSAEEESVFDAFDCLIRDVAFGAAWYIPQHNLWFRIQLSEGEQYVLTRP